MQINFTFQSILQRINSVQFSSIAQLCPTLCNPMDFPNIRVFSKESVLCIKWPKYWSFSFSISPSNEYSGLISFRMDWLYLLVLQGTLESSPTPQFKSTNSSVLSFLYSPNLPAHLPSAPVQQRGGDCRPQLPLQGSRPLGPWARGALLPTLGCFLGALLTPLSRTKFRITLGVCIPAKELEKKVRLSPQTPYGGPQLKAKDWVCLMLTQHPSPGPFAEMTTGKTIALTRRTFVGKVMSLLFNMPSRLVITFLPRSKCLLISWLQSPSAVILEHPKIKSDTVSTVSPSISHEVMGPDAMIFVF